MSELHKIAEEKTRPSTSPKIKKVAIFDFDLTMTREHTHNLLRALEDYFDVDISDNDEIQQKRRARCIKSLEYLPKELLKDIEAYLPIRDKDKAGARRFRNEMGELIPGRFDDILPLLVEPTGDEETWKKIFTQLSEAGVEISINSSTDYKCTIANYLRKTLELPEDIIEKIHIEPSAKWNDEDKNNSILATLKHFNIELSRNVCILFSDDQQKNTSAARALLGKKGIVIEADKDGSHIPELLKQVSKLQKMSSTDPIPEESKKDKSPTNPISFFTTATATTTSTDPLTSIMTINTPVSTSSDPDHEIPSQTP